MKNIIKNISSKMILFFSGIILFISLLIFLNINKHRNNGEKNIITITGEQMQKIFEENVKTKLKDLEGAPQPIPDVED